MTLSLPWSIVAASVIISVALYLVYLRAVRDRVSNDPLIAKVTELLNRQELHLGSRLDSMQSEIMRDLNGLHERVEYLEQRDRERR